jgi:eukaryotic-like serine/threonine-protein kinase
MIELGDVLLGRYEIRKLLGRGGMAEVYRAFDTRRQYAVAVKVLREDLAEDWDFVRRFQAEAESLARLAHQNIVRFYSFEHDDHAAFIVMDLIEGDTLRRRLFESQGRPLAPARALPIVRQVAAALTYAHSEGIIHRDVKPGNIMLRPDGTVLLSDFGIAKAADATTVTMAMPGTPAYMSPEQCRGAQVDARTDVYALGVVLYEMLAGRRPFVGELAPDTVTGGTHERVRWEQMHAAPSDPRLHNPALTDGIARVMLQALAKAPNDRYPSALALADALEAACMPPRPAPSEWSVAAEPPDKPPLPPATVQPAEPLPPASRPGHSRGVLAALAVVALAVLAIAATFGLGQSWGHSGSRLAAAPATAMAAPAFTATDQRALVARATLAPATPTAAATPTPRSTATATLRPTETPTATAAPTETLTATAAPTATPTRTKVPPTATRAPTRRPPSPTPVPPTAAPVAIPAPVLIRPSDGFSTTGRVNNFAWTWPGEALDANQGFEVRIWRDGQPDHYGAAGIVRGQTWLRLDDVRTAYGVQQGGPGSYHWTVALVQVEPYKRIGPEAPPRTLLVDSSGGGGGGGPSNPPAPTSPPP